MKADDLSQIRLGFDSHRGPSAPRRGFSLLYGGVLMVLLGLMDGCVTEHSGGTQMSSDPDAALDKRGALARQYIGVGDWENAKRNLELVREVDLNNAEVFEAFALVYQSTGEFEMAENQFRAALRAEPTLSGARNNYLCGFPLSSEMGILRLEAGDTNEAARYHSTYRTVSPQQSPRGLLLSLEIADQTGDQDALGSYELALRNLYPGSAEYRVWMERQSR